MDWIERKFTGAGNDESNATTNKVSEYYLSNLHYLYLLVRCNIHIDRYPSNKILDITDDEPPDPTMKLRIPNQSPLQSLCAQCRHKLLRNTPNTRLFTNSSHNLNSSHKPPPPSAFNMRNLSATLRDRTKSTVIPPHIKNPRRANQSLETDPLKEIAGLSAPTASYYLHCFTTKHNTHLTLSNPSGQPLMSVSTGDIGFRKAARGTYDAAFQLGAYFLGRIQEKGWLRDIHALELIFRDFGPGREAIQKILLGVEGKFVRNRIIRVMDATRLKFGGTRSKKPRRL